ncbi:MAG TPA: hypothetical protein VGI76_03855 [Solirubrobacteraceae bacterium]|jgi:hypothetical protein
MAEIGDTNIEQLRRVATRLIELGAAAHWRGPDPYDGMFVRWPAPLVAGRRRRQAIIQLHARSPLDVRRLYRRHHSLVPKAPALLGQAAARLLAVGEDPNLRELAHDALGTLTADTACGEEGWGYPWPTQTRWSYYPAGSPNIVATAFSANALAEASPTLGQPAWRLRAQRAAAWVLHDLFLADEGYFAYHGHSDRLVHNANLLGAALVHEFAPDGAVEAVRVATARTLDAQRPDGTWPYGEAAGLEWVDSFHTGYILDSLCRLEGVDPRIPAAIERGAGVYASAFFDADGRASLWHGKPYPEDAHSAGTGMTVLARLVRRGCVPVETVERVAHRARTYMMRDNGHAVFRRQPWGATRVSYLRWCDAPMALGLASVAALLAEHG